MTYGVKNLATLTIESVHDLIVNTFIPRLTATWEKETTMTTVGNNTVDLPKEEAISSRSHVTAMFLRAHRLQSMSLTTTWRWMRLLGFQYDSCKKSFYVDGHERDNVVANPSTFCRQYLTEYKPSCNCWIQLSMDEARTIKNLNIRLAIAILTSKVTRKESKSMLIIEIVRCSRQSKGRSGTKIQLQESTTAKKRKRPQAYVSQRQLNQSW